MLSRVNLVLDIFPMLDTANFYKLFNISAPNSQNEL